MSFLFSPSSAIHFNMKYRLILKSLISTGISYSKFDSKPNSEKISKTEKTNYFHISLLSHKTFFLVILLLSVDVSLFHTLSIYN